MPDNFQFNFTHSDAVAVVAEIGRRLDLARQFGYPRKIDESDWYDQVTESWFPHWWPEWAK